MESLLLFIPLLLLVSSILIGLSSNVINNLYSGIIATILVFISFVFSLFLLFTVYMSDNLIYYNNFYNWISIYGLDIGIGYLIDKFSSIIIYTKLGALNAVGTYFQKSVYISQVFLNIFYL